jgi:folate-binding protein YgfZ
MLRRDWVDYNRISMQILAQQDESVSSLSNSREELTALVAGCGVHRPQRGFISLTGGDRVRWLNGMVTNNVRDLAVGHGVYAFLLNPQGKIQADLYAFNRGKDLVVETEIGQVPRIQEIFDRYIIMDDVEVQDLSDRTVALELIGPRSADLVKTLGISVEDLRALQFAETKWNDVPITLVRGDNPCFPNYELWVSAEKVESPLNALQQVGVTPVHEDTLETFRILCGVPKLGQDIKERTLPQETGQERALNFSKGCYVGQEIVERIRSRGAVHLAFVGFEVEGSAPAPGTKVQSDGKDVGEISSVMSAPLEGKRLAIGYLRKEFIAGEKTLTAGEKRVKTVALPFKDIFG